MSLDYHIKHKGVAARGHLASQRDLPKVSVGWRRDQLEAINRRVVKHNSTFAAQVRRLMDIALRMDHLK